MIPVNEAIAEILAELVEMGRTPAPIPADAWEGIRATNDERVTAAALRWACLPKTERQAVVISWWKSGRGRLTEERWRGELGTFELALAVAEEMAS